MIGDICRIFAPSGEEKFMQDFIKEQLSDKFESVEIDNFGNAVCRTGHGGLCIECGMDSCGIMAVSTKEEKVYFAGVGGINAEYLIGKRILFKNGDFGIVRYDGKASADSKISDLHLEMNTKNLAIGDFGVVETAFCENSEKLFANGLGNRIGLVAVITALSKTEKPKNLCVVFSAQKRLGARGIQAFFNANNFERVITVDAVSAEAGIQSGKGCSLVAVDKNAVCELSLREELKALAERNNIKMFTSVTEENFCMGDIITSGDGKACAGIGIPVSSRNKTFEAVCKADFNSAVELLCSIINNA